MIYPPVLSKLDFVRRYRQGEFGNGSPTWDTLEAWDEGRTVFPENSLFNLRSRHRGGITLYNLCSDEVHRYYAQWSGDKPYISVMCPHDKTILQGEILQGSNGLGLYYTTDQRPMREALRSQSCSVEGLAAVMLLKKALNPKSYDWLQVLLDRYPGHVVEFTALSTEWGTLPGYNTLFWEVRDY